MWHYTCGAKDATQIGDEEIKAWNKRKIDDFGIPAKCVSWHIYIDFQSNMATFGKIDEFNVRDDWSQYIETTGGWATISVRMTLLTNRNKNQSY